MGDLHRNHSILLSISETETLQFICKRKFNANMLIKAPPVVETTSITMTCTGSTWTRIHGASWSRQERPRVPGQHASWPCPTSWVASLCTGGTARRGWRKTLTSARRTQTCLFCNLKVCCFIHKPYWILHVDLKLSVTCILKKLYILHVHMYNW